MAMSRQASTTSLLGGTTRFSSKTQNQNDGVDGLIARPGLGKPRLTSGKIRSTLGNISNNSSVAVDSRKVVRDDTFAKPLKPAMRYMATRSSTDKENVSSRKVQEKVEKPVPLSVSPMDTSSPPKVALPSHIDDIDRDDKNNPQLVSDYVNDIYDYLRKLEDQFAIKPKYLEGQAINARMRAILIDWLVQVHLRFHLLQETLYLTVAIIDRFLQEQEVGRSKLQLVGVTSMLIASKYEEMYAPEINDFVYITDNAYKKKDICVMERLILRTLGYNLGRPLPLHFLRRNSKAGEVDANKHTLAKYLTELTITDYDMVQTKPSEIAAASLCLSVKLFDNSEWNDTLQHYSTYTEEQLRPTMAKMANLVARAGTGKLTTIKTKYSSSKFMRIALIPELKSALITELAETSRQ